MSNSLDPDQAHHAVGPDLGPNCLQRLAADGKRCRYQGKSFIKIHMPPYLLISKSACLFDLILYIPVNNLSVTFGQVFLG